MKRELPVMSCTECGGAGYNMRVQAVVVAKSSTNHAAAALTQLQRPLIGSNVFPVKQPDITVIRNARGAEGSATYSRVKKRPFKMR
jgi:hypothetical protein